MLALASLALTCIEMCGSTSTRSRSLHHVFRENVKMKLL